VKRGSTNTATIKKEYPTLEQQKKSEKRKANLKEKR